MAQLVEHNGGDLLKLTDIEKFHSSDQHAEEIELLGSLFDRYGSDKTMHNYHPFYAAAFDDRSEVGTVLEIGLGTNNPDVVSTMGRTGRPGASLRAFREFFPAALIFGADVDRDILFNEERIETCHVDQTDQASFASLSRLTRDDVDLIIDDGLHAPNANLAVLLYALDHLAVGGWVAIEDVVAEAVPLWQVVAALLPSSYECELKHAPALSSRRDVSADWSWLGSRRMALRAKESPMREEGLRPGPTGLYGRRRLLKLGAAGAAGAFVAACARKAGVTTTTTTRGRGPVTSSSGSPSDQIASSTTPASAGGEQGGPAFLTSVNSGKRYLQDQHGNPFLMVGDSAWGLGVGISTTDMSTYFSTRQAQGFNTVLVALVANNSTTSTPNGQTFDGIDAFTGTVGGYPDMTTPNATYWARMDTMVSLAAANGISLMLVPIDAANIGGPSFCTSMARANGHTSCVTFGNFLGNRYKNSPNVFWMHGNDYNSGSDDTYVGGILTGIQAVAPTMLHTVEYTTGNFAPGTHSLQATSSWKDGIQINQCYPNSSSVSNVWKVGQAAYAATPAMPSFMGEWVYENNTSTPQTNFAERASEYWTMLAGNLGGYFYGNEHIYPFPEGWQSSLTSTVVTEFVFWASLFRGINWWTLVPDSGNMFLTGGISSGTNLSLGALAADGSLGVVYAPSANPRVDMSKMRGNTLARWYDPTAGTFTSVEGSPFPNSGTHSFPNPGKHSDGSHDWVLVLTA